MYKNYICIYTYVYIYIYIHIRSRAPRPPPTPRPPMVWEAASSLWCGVWWMGSPSLLPLVGRNLPPFSSLWCGGWGRLHAGKSCSTGGPSRVGSPGGREASLVRKPYSVEEDFVLRLWDVRLGISADLGEGLYNIEQ